LKEALAELGECRALVLTNEGQSPAGLSAADFVAPVPFDFRSSRWKWLWRHFTFAEYRQDTRYDEILRDIRSRYSYDLAFCSFFRTTCVAPTTIVPCFVDVDAIPEAAGRLTKLLWPLTKRVMRRRARDFRSVFVIRESDRRIFDAATTTVLPGISATAKLCDENAVRQRRVLFVGSMRWAPNKRAVDLMLSMGVPKLLSSLGYTLRLVGEGTNDSSNRAGLSAAGFVDDIHSEYAAADIVVCPVMAGSGANIKLAEAVQSGCAVLASANAATAYDGFLLAGIHFEVFSNYSEFTAKLTALIANRLRVNELRNNCRAIAERRLNKEHVKQILQEGIRRALSKEIAVAPGHLREAQDPQHTSHPER
jgi:glycosyltransferase involved in cell wall biosynthesis